MEGQAGQSLDPEKDRVLTPSPLYHQSRYWRVLTPTNRFSLGATASCPFPNSFGTPFVDNFPHLCAFYKFVVADRLPFPLYSNGKQNGLLDPALHTAQVKMTKTSNLVHLSGVFLFFSCFSYAESWAILSSSTSVGLKYGLLCYAYSTPTIFVRTSGQRYALSSRRPRSIGLAGSIGNPEIRVTLGLTKTY